MTNNCLVNRTAEGLTSVIDELDSMEQTRFSQMRALDVVLDVRATWQAANARATALAARLMAQVMLARSESLGSHYRADCI